MRDSNFKGLGAQTFTQLASDEAKNQTQMKTDIASGRSGGRDIDSSGSVAREFVLKNS